MSSLSSAITYRSIVDRNAAAVEITLDLGPNKPWRIVATGSSKRAKGDAFEPSTGHRLALARALKNLARELEKSVNV